MHIANPIYDTVFKYLMEDEALAKLLLSTILGEEIIELAFKPQERTTELGPRFLTVYRLDFAATIRNAAGAMRQVLIEIQKAKLPSDIMRFRRYLGEQYRDPANVHEIAVTADQPPARQALPILTIYFLGHPLDSIPVPVVRVSRQYWDHITGTELTAREPFIESLTHDSYVIQIPRLHRAHRSELEALLQIFDQDLIVGDDRHVLRIDEGEVPEHFRPFLRRLQKAMAEPALAEAMSIEDEILNDLKDLERATEAAQSRAEAAEMRAKAAETRAETAETRAETAESRAEQERAEKERLLERLRRAGLEPD